LKAEEWSVVTSASGHERLVDRIAAEISRMGEEAKATSYLALVEEERAELSEKVREVPRLLLEHSPAATVVKMSVLPSEFAALVKRVEGVASDDELPVATLVRASGTLYGAFVPAAKDGETLGRLAKAWGGLQRAVREAGGTAMIEFCPPELKQFVNVWGTPRADWELMRRVKQVFDPGGVFSPGRFVGGL
jgi:FAD/FMN-containing dehydrogenase